MRALRLKQFQKLQAKLKINACREVLKQKPLYLLTEKDEKLQKWATGEHGIKEPEVDSKEVVINSLKRRVEEIQMENKRLRTEVARLKGSPGVEYTETSGSDSESENE